MSSRWDPRRSIAECDSTPTSISPPTKSSRLYVYRWHVQRTRYPRPTTAQRVLSDCKKIAVDYMSESECAPGERVTRTHCLAARDAESITTVLTREGKSG